MGLNTVNTFLEFNTKVACASAQGMQMLPITGYQPFYIGLFSVLGPASQTGKTYMWYISGMRVFSFLTDFIFLGGPRIFFIRPSLDGTYYGMARYARPSVRATVSTKKHRCKWQIFFKFGTQVCFGVPSINLLFVFKFWVTSLNMCTHNSIISDFSIFGIHHVHRVIF